jgi:hypothetical protein
LLLGIQRCKRAELELNDQSSEVSDEPKLVSGNLGDCSPEPLDFAFEKPLSVSHVSKTLGFRDAKDIKNGGN